MGPVDDIKEWLRGGLHRKIERLPHPTSRAEIKLISRITRNIGKYILNGIPIIDLGTNGKPAIRDKLAPIARAVQPCRIVLVDSSPSMLALARDAMRSLTGMPITRILDNFYEKENSQYVDRAALITYSGCAIGNIHADNLSKYPPKHQLAEHIEHICAKSHGGRVLITFNSILDERTARVDQEDNPSFHLNFLDNAVATYGFPEDVRKKIAYRSVPNIWCDNRGKPIVDVVGHYAEFAEDASFKFGEERFEITAGTRLLIDGQFNYSLKFFKECAEEVGTTIIRTWQEGSIMGVLLQSPYRPSMQPASTQRLTKILD